MEAAGPPKLKPVAAVVAAGAPKAGAVVFGAAPVPKLKPPGRGEVR